MHLLSGSGPFSFGIFQGTEGEENLCLGQEDYVRLTLNVLGPLESFSCYEDEEFSVGNMPGAHFMLLLFLIY